ncbi:hypothetical protein OAO65_02160 [Flavobacteriales bacterium]|nr:hypothetical protein [Flavobacteriales bacterium]
MSKRYGRQQKKKARLRIEQLGNQIENIKNQTASTVNAARNIIEAVRDHCPNSVFLDKARIDKGQYLHVPMSYICNPFVVEGASDFATPIDMRRINLFDLELSIRDTEFKDAVHFQLDLEAPRHGENERACYRISKEGFKFATTYQIVTGLVELLKETVK